MYLPSFLADTMSAVRDALAAAGPVLWFGVPVAVALLVVAAVLLRRWARTRSLAGRVSTVATLLGLSWSAQGMWDSAVHAYGVPWQIASVLFIVFECMLMAQMLKAHQYRERRARRARFVRAVWMIAAIMGLVVAFGEGLGQAPLRLAVPLLVAFNWYMDLTADDDPEERPATSWRWTPREVGLTLGLLRHTDADLRDATAAERKYLVDRMKRLQFGIEYGTPSMSWLLRRRERVARLKLNADPEMIAEVARQLALAGAKFEVPETHPVPPPQETEPTRVPTPEPTLEIEPPAPALEPPAPQRPARPRSTGRIFYGEPIAAADVESVAKRVIYDSVTAERPNGMSTAELIGLFSPPLGQRTAEGWAAQARRMARTDKEVGRVNGSVPDLAEVP